MSNLDIPKMANPVKRRRLSLDGRFDAVQVPVAGPEDRPQAPDASSVKPSEATQQRTLFVRSIPKFITSESLAEHFSQSYPLKHAIVVSDPTSKESRGYGFVTFADTDDAQRAAKEFNGSTLEGKKIRVEVAERRHREIDGQEGKSIPSATAVNLKAEREDQKNQSLPPKLIVRNLPWSIKEPEQLSNLFRSYGKIKHSSIPSKKPGLQSGFGFVVIRGRKNAEKAIAGVNGKEIDGRVIAVDWAVDKTVWEDLQNGTDALNADTTKPVTKTVGKTSEDVASDEDLGDDNAMPDAHGSELDVEDGDWSSEDGDGDQKSKTINESYRPPEDTNTSTIFVRNLPFTSTDETLYEHFAQFGPIRYARVVLDRETEQSKGTGFVCFYSQDDTVTCVKESPKKRDTTAPVEKRKIGEGSLLMKHSVLQNEAVDTSGRYTLEGRVLQISRAVSKSEATKLEAEGTTLRNAKEKDKRRLYLLSEGTIPQSSPLYSKLSSTEINMREASARQRQSLVKNNPSLHMSLTRLSIRNIPRHVSSKDLKALAREAVVGFATDVKNGLREPLSREELRRGADAMREAEVHRKLKGRGIVKQAKIVFEGESGSKLPEKTGAGRSRGYGFIEYTSHRSTLMGLRWLNGHAVFGGSKVEKGSKEVVGEKTKRLIVEFAIENAQVVNRRHEYEEKARTKQDQPSIRYQNDISAASLHGPGSRKLQKGSARKRAKPDREATTPAVAPTKSEGIDKDKLAKRNRIIGNKRMKKKQRAGK